MKDKKQKQNLEVTSLQTEPSSLFFDFFCYYIFAVHNDYTHHDEVAHVHNTS